MELEYWTDKAREENPNLPIADTANNESSRDANNESSLESSNENLRDANNECSLESSNESLHDVDISISKETEESGIFSDSDSPEISIPDVTEITEKTVKRKKTGRICKAIFLGIPFGIPISLLMLAVLSVFVVAMCLVFGLMVMFSAALAIGGLALIVLGISEVHVSLGPSLLLIGSGIFGCGIGIFFALLTRLLLKYVFPRLFGCYILPIRFIRLFFCERKNV